MLLVRRLIPLHAHVLRHIFYRNCCLILLFRSMGSGQLHNQQSFYRVKCSNNLHADILTQFCALLQGQRITMRSAHIILRIRLLWSPGYSFIFAPIWNHLSLHHLLNMDRFIGCSERSCTNTSTNCSRSQINGRFKRYESTILLRTRRSTVCL